MNKIERYLLHGAGYTVLIQTLYYALAAMLSLDSVHITAGRFFLILLFGYIISAAELISGTYIQKIWLKNTVIYAVTLCAFLLIFVFGSNLASKGGATVFISIAVYTIIYFVALLITFVIRKYFFRNDTKNTAEKRNAAEAKNTKYKNLYKE